MHEDHVQREGDCGEQNVEQCFIQVPMRRHHNPNKVPPFKPDPEHWTRKVHSWKAKVAYETEDDALLDCANYCILTLMEYQKRKEHGTD